MAGRAEDVVPCIKCMRCHDSTVYGHFFQCSVNPTIGIVHCLDSMIRPVTACKKVAVIGGGPAGMYAALTAAGRGHTVTLYEKTEGLGGTLKFADKVAFKYSLTRFKNYLIEQIEQSPVTVCLNTEALPELLKEEGYDQIITAIGAEPIIPSISGIERAIYATDVYGQEGILDKEVVVIGGGQVGCETALHLAQLGKKVTILEMQGALAPDASRTHRDDIMAEMKKEAGLSEITTARCTRIDVDGVNYEKDGVEHKLAITSVILATGMRPRIAQVDRFARNTSELWIAGDCRKARTVEMAVREGYFAGINI